MEKFNKHIFWEIKLPEFTWEYISPSIKKLRGYTVKDAMKRSLQETLTVKSFQIVSEKIKNELLPEANEKDNQIMKLEHFCKNGSTKWFSVKISVIRNERGRPVKIIGISHDIHNQEQQLLAQNEKIKQLKEYAVKMNELREIIPICASCKQIRKDDGSWEQLESYISKNFPVDFSHGICKPCTKKLYPELNLDE